jgi:hypothetical protein
MEQSISNSNQNGKKITRFSIAMISIQILDIIVHIATNQIEPLRIASNIIIIIAAVLWIIAVVHVVKFWAGFASGLVYLVLNGIFLAEFGLINPSSGSIRVPLFLFVLSTIIVNSLILVFSRSKK